MRECVNTVRITRERNEVLVKNTRQDRVQTQSPVANHREIRSLFRLIAFFRAEPTKYPIVFCRAEDKMVHSRRRLRYSEFRVVRTQRGCTEVKIL